MMLYSCAVKYMGLGLDLACMHCNKNYLDLISISGVICLHVYIFISLSLVFCVILNVLKHLPPVIMLINFHKI